MKVTLNAKSQSIVMAALLVASEIYKSDAEAMRKAGLPRLVEKFEEQAEDAEQLRNWIEERSAWEAA